MKKSLVVLALALALIYLPGCNKYSPVAPEKNPGDTGAPATRAEQIALELISQSGWAVDETVQMHSSAPVSLAKSSGSQMISFVRQPIAGNIVHYAFQVPVGPGPYDVIGIHRVVKEKVGNQPINTRKVLFLQHGDVKDFTGMYLPGTRGANFPFDFGFAVYMAKKNVDVWGIDQAWTLVPYGVTDFAFMADWGIQKQVDDLNLAISVARVVRKFMGMGYSKVILSGYSSGVATGYALLNQETQIEEATRQVNGFIPVDLAIKIDDENLRQFLESDANACKATFDAGQFQLIDPFPMLGNLARTDPDGQSPFIPGFTNLQTVLFFCAGQSWGDQNTFHYIAGILQNGFPVNFRYVTLPQVLDFLESGTPYEAMRFEFEWELMTSGAVDLPFDDNLSQIQIPILNVAAAGGYGQASVFTTTFLGSTDITNLIVSAGAPSIIEEFAHIDLFIASNAERLVWRPMFDWIRAHSIVLAGTNEKMMADIE